jgi:ketosteroid isomerase-like protein
VKVNFKTAAAILLLLAVGTCPTWSKARHVDNTEAVKSVLDRQAEAWNKGDLVAFMTGYLDSPDTSYTSGGVEVWGYDSIHDRYVKKYGTTRSDMGKLSFSNLRIVEINKGSAFCVGQFHLVKAEPTGNADGVFSLVLKQTAAGWKIIHDHTTASPRKD